MRAEHAKDAAQQNRRHLRVGCCCLRSGHKSIQTAGGGGGRVEREPFADRRRRGGPRKRRNGETTRARVSDSLYPFGGTKKLSSRSRRFLFRPTGDRGHGERRRTRRQDDDGSCARLAERGPEPNAVSRNHGTHA